MAWDRWRGDLVAANLMAFLPPELDARPLQAAGVMKDSGPGARGVAQWHSRGKTLSSSPSTCKKKEKEKRKGP